PSFHRNHRHTDGRNRERWRVRFEVELQQLQQELAVAARNGEANGTDMKERFLGAGVVSFERQRNLDFSDEQDVHAQTSTELFEKPVQHEKQRLQQLHRSVQFHVLFEYFGKLFRDQRMLICTSREAPPAKAFLSETLDNRNFGKCCELRAGMNTP